jgi:hypothetical protein
MGKREVATQLIYAQAARGQSTCAASISALLTIEAMT